MKKTFTVLSAAALAVSLAACTPAPRDTTGTKTTNYTAPRTLPGTGVDGTRTGGTTGTTGYRTGTTGITGTTGAGNYGPGTGTGIYGGAGIGGYGIHGGVGTGTTGTGTTGTGGTGVYGGAGVGGYGLHGGVGLTGRNDGLTGGYDPRTRDSGLYRSDAYGNVRPDQNSIYRTHDGRTTSTQSASQKVGFVYVGKKVGTAGAKGTHAASTGTRTAGTAGTSGAAANMGTPNGTNTNTGATPGSPGQTMTPNGTPMVYVDRQNLAYAIANACKAVPGCQAATVLTANNQAFVGCDTTGLSPSDAARALSQCHAASESVCPRSYKVYSTNNRTIINKIHQNPTSFANKTNKQFEQMIGYPSKINHATTSTSPR